MKLVPQDVIILRWLASHTRATAAQIAVACAIAFGAVRARLALLERARFVAGRRDVRSEPVQHIFWVTLKGLRAAKSASAASGGAG